MDENGWSLWVRQDDPSHRVWVTDDVDLGYAGPLGTVGLWSHSGTRYDEGVPVCLDATQLAGMSCSMSGLMPARTLLEEFEPADLGEFEPAESE